MSQPPILNYDILLEVLKICPRPECSRLMRTSRILHAHGFETLLSPSISILTQKHLLRFLACFHTDAEKRCKYVRSVQFGFFDLTEPAALELANTLPRMCNLEVLSISYSEDVILSHPALPHAFAALTSVRELRLGYARAHTLRMLQSFRSKLISVDVSFLGVPPDGDGFFETLPFDDIPLYHPAVILEHSRSSLQTLSSYRWDLDVDTMPDPALVYPHMRRLELERSLLPRTMALIIAYPNLTHLQFHTGESEFGHYDSARLNDYDLRHALNASQQLSWGRTWDSLLEFRGSPLDLYLLGLTCTIDSLQLYSLHSDLCYMLAPMLAYARPRKLTLEHWPANLRATPSTDDVFSALAAEAISRLDTFSIEAGLDKDDGAVDIAAVLNSLRSSLLSAPLQEVRMKIWTHALDPRPDDDSVIARMRRQHLRLPKPPPPKPEDYPLCFAERSAEDFDLESYVRRFMDEVPTLQRAQIILIGPRDRWRRATIVDGKLHIEDRRN